METIDDVLATLTTANDDVWQIQQLAIKVKAKFEDAAAEMRRLQAIVAAGVGGGLMTLTPEASQSLAALVARVQDVRTVLQAADDIVLDPPAAPAPPAEPVAT